MSSTIPSEKLLNLTQAMLLAAEAGNWDEVRKMEMQRQAVLGNLQAIISAPDRETYLEAMADDVREVLSMNKRMLDLGLQVKGELAGVMDGLRQGRKAVDAYHGIK